MSLPPLSASHLCLLPTTCSQWWVVSISGPGPEQGGLRDRRAVASCHHMVGMPHGLALSCGFLWALLPGDFQVLGSPLRARGTLSKEGLSRPWGESACLLITSTSLSLRALP